ncbi:MAG: sporulation integral membrane protein YtvI [Firmicutes bacterium]|nr:sporulation integral membrane protein YtvI [Bacillota bacterium]
MRSLGLSIIYSLAFIGISYVLVRFVLGFVWPFVLAAVFAVMIEPAVSGMQRSRVPRGIAVLVSLFLLVTLLVFVITLVLSKFIHELAELYDSLPAMYALAADAAAKAAQSLRELGRGYSIPVDQYLTFQIEPIYRGLQTILVNVLMSATNLPSLLLGFLVSMLAAFFMSKDRDVLSRFATGLLPPEARGRLYAANKDIISTFLSILRAQLGLATVTGVLSCAGLWLFGFDSPLVLGAVCGLLDFLPLFGPSLVYLPMILWGIGTGNAGMAIKTAVVFAVVVGVRQMLEPRMIGKAAEMHPLASLFSIYVGVRLFGPLGFVLGPLAAVVLRALIRSGLMPAFNGGRGA